MSTLHQTLDRLTPEQRAFLLAQLQTAASAGALREDDRIARVDAETHPLSYAQQRLWVLCELEPAVPFYNIAAAVRIEGSLNEGAVRAALGALARRHDMLRARIIASAGSVSQIVSDHAELPLVRYDLASKPAETRERAASEIVREFAAKSFDLAQQPLARATLIKLDSASHILALVVHHIIADGKSMEILTREFTHLYERFARGSRPSLPELPIRYSDFSRWQRGLLSGPLRARQLAYWRRQLRALPVLDLLADHPRPPRQTFRGALVTHSLPATLRQKLAAVSRQADGTVHMLMLGAFQALLSRYCGQQDIVTGTSAAGRNRKELEPLVGFFVNTLLIRTQMRPGDTWLDYLGRVRETVLEAHSNQDLQFDMLVHELHPERSLSHNPLFQAAFDYQYSSSFAGRADTAGLSAFDFERGYVRADLEFHVRDNGKYLTLLLGYSTELFEARSIRAMLRRLETMLHSIGDDPLRPLAELPLMSASERSAVLALSNSDRKRDIPSVGAHTLIERRVVEQPKSPAAVWNGGSLSYAELGARSLSIAARLQALGAIRHSRVAIWAVKSPAAIAGVLGTLKAGCAFIPLDPACPRERARAILHGAQAHAVLCDEETAVAVRSWGIPTVDLEQTAYAEVGRFTPVECVAEDAAYIIFTSGSSGTPKGVVVSHGALVNRMLDLIQVQGIGPNDRATHFLSPAFDASTEEIFHILAAGGALVLHPHPEKLDPADFLEFCCDHSATVLHLPPAYWHSLAGEGLRLPDSVRVLVTGGSSTSPEKLSALRRNIAHSLDFWNAYGPTESSGSCTLFKTVLRPDGPPESQAPIGRPIANVSTYILDEAMEPLPPGIPGDLFAGGACVATSYLDDPVSTASAMCPDPFSAKPGARMYRTGDRARWLPDGNLEFLGRRDSQVKIRGRRIEIGEIEATLRQHPAVGDCAVAQVTTAAGSASLSAYFTISRAKRNEVRARLAKERSTTWLNTFEDSYSSGVCDGEPEFNIAGWNSSFTGLPYSKAEMREWVDNTVDRIRGLNPRSVLEVGCGSGLLLFRLAPGCERYAATDFSESAVASVRTMATHKPELAHVVIERREALDFSSWQPESFDTIILNSVSQYFTGIDDLLALVRGALGLLAAGGSLFIGDVRSLPLLEIFHCSVEAAHAAPDTPLRQIRLRCRSRVAQDNELAVDPRFFHSIRAVFPEIGDASVALKWGRRRTEMNLYRYDAILRKGRQDFDPAAATRFEWQPGMDLSCIEDLLDCHSGQLAIAGIPDARVSSDVALYRILQKEDSMTVAAARSCGESRHGLDLNDLRDLAVRRGLAAHATWPGNASGGTFDFHFGQAASCPMDLTSEPDGSDMSRYANDPLLTQLSSQIASELKQWMAERLPDYMTPQSMVQMERLPLTANGKIDREHLPAAGQEREERSYSGPESAAERLLAGIWEKLLGVERIGVEDNFFELGGDSILSIQAVARAREGGLRLTPKQMFEQQTIRGLGKVGRWEKGQEEEKRGAAAGEVAATPIQKWFWEEQGESGGREHFNQAVLLEGAGVRREALRAAVAGVLRQHDAVRLRWRRREGEWEQSYGTGEAGGLEVVDLSGVEKEERSKAIEGVCEAAQGGLRVEEGPLLRAVWMELGEGAGGRLLVVGHHLIVDGVSWRILLEDLQKGYGQAERGEGIELGRGSSTYQEWSRRLWEWGGGARVQGELAYWEGELGGGGGLKWGEGEGGGLAGEAREVRRGLGVERTRQLLQERGGAGGGQAQELLLAGLGRGLEPWMRGSGVVVEVEGHGREALGEGEAEELDVTRTVGWFTSLYPVVVEGWRGRGAGEVLEEMKERWRRVPGKGLGYGLLRYGGGEGEARLKRAGKAEISFNYLGQFDQALERGGQWKGAREGSGRAQSAEARRTHQLDIVAAVVGGRLQVSWYYAPRHMGEGEAEALADRYMEGVELLIAHCQAGGAAAYTAADFPLAHLTAAELNGIAGERGLVEDIYPLTPLQQGMLFHTLHDDTGSGAYIQQLQAAIHGELALAQFRAAWENVVRRHPALRSRLKWEDVKEWCQVVERSVELPWVEMDWRSLPPEAQAEKLDAFLLEDRQRAFDLCHAPLARWTVIRMAATRFHFVWTQHHTILDGWSAPIVLEEVSRYYSAGLRGERLLLSEPPRFARYLEWLQGRDRVSAERYWRSALEGFTTPVPLPLPRPSANAVLEGDRFREISTHLSPKISAGLVRRAREQRVTLNTVFEGIWGLLLGRYSGQSDVLFGAVVSGRPPEIPDSGKIVGMLINTVPRRVRIKPLVAAGEWLRNLQAERTESQEHEYCPLVDVHGWSNLPRQAPMFETLFVFENQPAGPVTQDASTAVRFEATGALGRTNHPITILVGPGERITLSIAYDRSRIEAEAAERLLEHLAALAHSFAHAPDAPLARLSMISETEHRLRTEWNQTTIGYHAPGGLHELIERQTAETPGALAVEFRGVSLTYAELDCRANRLARRLRTLGAGPDIPVAVLLERSLDLVVALLAVLKSGSAYVPLDPEDPIARIQNMLEGCGARLAVTEREQAAKLSGSGVRTVLMDAERDAINTESGETPGIQADPESLAYIIYTSGSTGAPKGAMNTHRGIVNRLLWMQQEYRLTAADRVLQKTPCTFDVSVWEFFWPLSTGACLVVAEPQEHRDPDRLIRTIAECGVSIIHFVPSMLAAFLEEPGVERCSSLRQIVCSGEALPAALVRKCHRLLPCRVDNLYGPTEAAVDVTYWSCPRDPSLERTLIGRPIANTRVHILDADGEQVPIGVAGELFLAGAGIGRGYVNQPGLTAERFVPSPFRDGSRLYRTGDIARFTSTGAIEYIGRGDNQVKIRGIRIELGEVESALLRHPGVRACAVLAHDDVNGKRLDAYVVAGDAEPPRDSDLRAFLRESLPIQMIPATFTRLHALPQLPNGKLDRKSLPDPQGSTQPVSRIPPRDDEEIRIAALWLELLGVDEVGAFDSFFDLGGHSLSLTRLASQIRSSFGLEIPLRALFEAPTVAGMATLIRERSGGVAGRILDAFDSLDPKQAQAILEEI